METETPELVPLLFPALPVVAEPALVLPETFALPLTADWLLTLVTPTSFTFCAKKLLLFETLTWLVELGPVVPTLIVESAGLAIGATSPLPFATLTDVLVVLLLPAAPVVAEPPLVLPETFAEPLAACCSLWFWT